MPSTTLSITYSSAGNRDKWTWSGWVKRNKLDGHQSLWCRYSDSNNYGDLRFQSDNGFTYQNYSGGSTNAQWNASQKFRDTNGWYHIVFVWDSGNATAADRMKAYVNGEDMAGSASTTPSQNTDSFINSAAAHKLGSRNSDQYFDGCMSHVHFCDGYAYSPTDFGETDSTTGQWKIKTNPSVSYGTNGYFMFKDDASVDDDSGNDNDFTASGNLTQTEDNPSNVFATLSPQLLPRGSGETIKFGNTFFGTSAAIFNTENSSFGIANGKYYFEVKLSDNGSDRRFRWGLQKEDSLNKTGENKVIGGTDNDAIGYAAGAESATQGSYFINQTLTTMSDGDINVDGAIYGFAIDLDNQRMYGHMNGTYFHSGNPSAGTGGIDVSSFYTVGEPLFPAFTVHNSNIEINFGNGYFGTTAITSEGTNASGLGKFEYDVPTGYTAICTKGLNE